MRRSFVATALIVLLLAVAVPAGAIVYGEPDGNRHPNVGWMVVEVEGDFFQWCSGSLIDSNVFLTASHCMAAVEEFFGDAATVWVTFDEIIDPDTSTFIAGTMHTHPDFGFSGPGGFSDPHDIAVIVLGQSVSLTPVQLPTLGLLDEMKADHETMS